MTLRSDLQYYSSVLEAERMEIQKLCQQTRNQESVEKYFRNNYPTYQNIKKVWKIRQLRSEIKITLTVGRYNVVR
jgi:hypothetical protein